MTPEPQRIELPHANPAAPRAGLPLLAMLAPLGIAALLWAVTGSALMILFAALSPVLALAGWIDGRRASRRARREALVEARARLDELDARIELRATRFRASAADRIPPLARLAPSEPGTAPRELFLGHGDLPSGIEWTTPVGAPGALELESAHARTRERGAAIADAPLIGGWSDVVASGPAVLVRAFARALVVRAALGSPLDSASVHVPPDETWANELPHPVVHGSAWEVRSAGERIVRVLLNGEPAAPDAAIVHLGDELGAPPRLEHPTGVAHYRPVLVGAAEARAHARAAAAYARRRGWRPASDLPELVPLAELLAEDAAPRAAQEALTAIVARDADGAVLLDLERDGPHALVAGTTGSGKSELLVSWVLALAFAHPPAHLGFLLIDFKGGAAFSPLEGVPHVVGIVSDLDPETAARAVESLRAELRRRERELARHGARSIGELAPGTLPRLVVVVDEFAALLAVDDGLHSVFADLAARGRSLGVHLVLCTQRPAGVVRDGVLANVTLRVCLRVLDAADSVAVVGDASAAALPAAQRGRALLGVDGATRLVQFALATVDDARRVSERWAGHPVPAIRPWVDPLPALLDPRELPAAGAPGALVIGLVDRPSEQCREPLVVEPWSAGGVLVLGAAGSGRTAALAAIANAARAAGETAVRWIADEPAELWQALVAPATTPRTLVIADDLDRTLAHADPEQRGELGELIARAVRDSRRTGLALAASARGIGGAVHGVQDAFEHRVLLRLATREDHLIAGGELAGYRAERRAGSAIWRGLEAHIALHVDRPAPWRATVPVVDLLESGAAVVTPYPAEWRGRLARAGVAVAEPGTGARESSPHVVLGDVDAWLGDYAGLGEVRRDGALLMVGCTASDHRALTRTRVALPPLARPDEAWLVVGGVTTRVRVRLGDDDASADDR